MKIEEIREIFSTKGEQCYQDKENTIPITGQYICKIVDVIITMKNGTKITIFCDNESIIDTNSEHPNAPIGIEDTLIEPMKDIKDIKVAWR